MNYLERNAELVSQFDGIFPAERIGELIGGGNTMTAYVGGVLAANGTEIPVAVKTFTKDHQEVFEKRNRTRFIRSLSFINLIDQELPRLAPMLPRFYSMLTNEAGNMVGQLTEDFSLGNSAGVWDYPFMWTRRPAEVRSIDETLSTFVSTLITNDPAENTPKLRPNDDFLDRCPNEVSGIGPRLVDLFGDPIEVDPYAKVSITDDIAQENIRTRIDRMLQVEKVANSMARFTVQLVR